MRTFIALTMVPLLPMLCGCGASLPTEDAAKDAIQQDITRRNSIDPNSVPIKVVSVHKTNGQRAVENEVERYKMEYNVEIQFTEDCFYGGSMRANPNPVDPSWQRKKKGERAVESSYQMFEKTENGWRAT